MPGYSSNILKGSLFCVFVQVACGPRFYFRKSWVGGRSRHENDSYLRNHLKKTNLLCPLVKKNFLSFHCLKTILCYWHSPHHSRLASWWQRKSTEAGTAGNWNTSRVIFLHFADFLPISSSSAEQLHLTQLIQSSLKCFRFFKFYQRCLTKYHKCTTQSSLENINLISRIVRLPDENKSCQADNWKSQFQ